MTDPDLDELLENAREEKSYFDDPGDLEGTAEENWARIVRDPTMARVVDMNPENFSEEHGTE